MEFLELQYLLSVSVAAGSEFCQRIGDGVCRYSAIQRKNAELLQNPQGTRLELPSRQNSCSQRQSIPIAEAGQLWNHGVSISISMSVLCCVHVYWRILENSLETHERNTANSLLAIFFLTKVLDTYQEGT